MTPHAVRRHAALAVSEPLNYLEAMEDEDWKRALDKEYQAILSNKTWHLHHVLPSQGRNIIDCKWVCKLKRRADDSIERHSACLVAKGFKQTYDINYEDTFSLVVYNNSANFVPCSI